VNLKKFTIMPHNRENRQERFNQNRWNEDLQRRGEDVYGEGEDYNGEGHRNQDRVGFSQQPYARNFDERERSNLRESYGEDRGNYGKGGYYGSTYREETYNRERNRVRPAYDEKGRQEGYRNQQGMHKGKGPRGYQRPDQRISDDVNDRLAEDPFIDASDIEVHVTNGEITLMGSVENRDAKRRAEDIVESVSGVKNVENRLKVKGNRDWTNRDGNTESRSKDTKRGAINQEAR
jgi:osmotically-inducible protein OsmY